MFEKSSHICCSRISLETEPTEMLFVGSDLRERSGIALYMLSVACCNCSCVLLFEDYSGIMLVSLLHELHFASIKRQNKPHRNVWPHFSCHTYRFFDEFRLASFSRKILDRVIYCDFFYIIKSYFLDKLYLCLKSYGILITFHFYITFFFKSV